jgi:hypothetical protein
MNIIELKNPQKVIIDEKLDKVFTQLENLLIELRKRELPQNIVEFINDSITVINSSDLIEKDLKVLVIKRQNAILKLVKKELKLVPKGYHATLWMLFGFSGFGIPIGVAFGLAMGNIGLLGIGLPIGMGVGAVVGLLLDKKAFKEGRQLDIVIKNL